MAHTIKGKVVSTSMNKTVTVEFERKFRHPRYMKVVSLSKKIKAHSEDPTIKLGDVVEIVSCRPLSATKFYRVVSPSSK
ncbi:MAG: 30S ribosomal protein S17 [bacterium]